MKNKRISTWKAQSALEDLKTYFFWTIDESDRPTAQGITMGKQALSVLLNYLLQQEDTKNPDNLPSPAEGDQSLSRRGLRQQLAHTSKAPDQMRRDDLECYAVALEKRCLTLQGRIDRACHHAEEVTAELEFDELHPERLEPTELIERLRFVLEQLGWGVMENNHAE